MPKPFVILALMLGMAACSHPNDRDVTQLQDYKRAIAFADRQRAAGCTGEVIECDAVHRTCAQLHMARAFACHSLINDAVRPLQCPEPAACVESSVSQAQGLLPQNAPEADRIDLAKSRLFAAEGRLRQLTGVPAAKAQCPSLAEGLAAVQAIKAELKDSASAEAKAAANAAAGLEPQFLLALNSPVRNCPK